MPLHMLCQLQTVAMCAVQAYSAEIIEPKVYLNFRKFCVYVTGGPEPTKVRLFHLCPQLRRNPSIRAPYGSSSLSLRKRGWLDSSKFPPQPTCCINFPQPTTLWNESFMGRGSRNSRGQGCSWQGATVELQWIACSLAGPSDSHVSLPSSTGCGERKTPPYNWYNSQEPPQTETQ